MDRVFAENMNNGGLQYGPSMGFFSTLATAASAVQRWSFNFNSQVTRNGPRFLVA